MNNLFPVNLNLRNRKCLVIGGGKIAERKVESLLSCGAIITLVSPEVTQNLGKLAETGEIRLINRKYVDTDLDGCFLVIIATDNRELNHKVADNCLSRNILVNVVDDPEMCNFTVPSVVRRGSLCIAISTDGKSPMLAKKIREELENYFGTEYAEFLDIMGKIRSQVMKDVPDEKKRRMIFESLIESDILQLIKKGDRDLVSKRINQCISLAIKEE